MSFERISLGSDSLRQSSIKPDLVFDEVNERNHEKIGLDIKWRDHKVSSGGVDNKCQWWEGDEGLWGLKLLREERTWQTDILIYFHTI